MGVNAGSSDLAKAIIRGKVSNPFKLDSTSSGIGGILIIFIIIVVVIIAFWFFMKQEEKKQMQE